MCFFLNFRQGSFVPWEAAHVTSVTYVHRISYGLVFLKGDGRLCLSPTSRIHQRRYAYIVLVIENLVNDHTYFFSLVECWLFD